MLFLIEVQNEKGEGVPGKFPTSLEIIDSWDPTKVFAEIVTSANEYEVSGKDGIMSIPVKIMCLGSEEDFIVFEFNIDGLLLETDSIEITQGGDFDTERPSMIVAPTGIEGDYMELGDGFGPTFIFTVKDSYCT